MDDQNDHKEDAPSNVVSIMRRYKPDGPNEILPLDPPEFSMPNERDLAERTLRQILLSDARFGCGAAHLHVEQHGDDPSIRIVLADAKLTGKAIDEDAMRDIEVRAQRIIFALSWKCLGKLCSMDDDQAERTVPLSVTVPAIGEPERLRTQDALVARLKLAALTDEEVAALV